MKLQLYNTLTRKKEVFKPIKVGQVGMYSCGPTVYWHQHIGNMRAYLFADVLRRVLEWNGLKVKHVVNVTDVGHLTSDRDEGEDKMESAARKEKKTANQIANFYFKEFEKDLKKLNIKSPWKWPRASEHVKDQIELIKKLEKKGYTYQTSDGLYFDSSKFKKYGELGRLNLEGLKEGKRVGFGEKKHKTDFALWKFSSSSEEKRQQEWKSPWGVGFPGWHLECSAMSMKYLGEHFDLHTGGEEHIQVHHTNEIAQAEAATGKKFVNYWLHFRWLLLKGEKMSKSKGAIYRLSELERKGYSPMDFRYLSLMTHYRKPLNFSLENLDAAKSGFQKFMKRVIEMKKIHLKGNDFSDRYTELFEEAINDDLNMPKAMNVVWKMVEDLDFDSKKKLKLLEKFDSVLGLGIKDFKEKRVVVPKEVKELVAEREKLRAAKMWAEADLFRQRIREKGFVVEDSSEGVKINKV